ncbi:MAG: hypothetical protein JRE61_13155 [Deltaproteobacteria bacterium]|nr:hypothetical protein [Deltaproteobacteria bacterium]
MAQQISFTKYENEVLPDFRKKLNLAESTEDVINFFALFASDEFTSIWNDSDLPRVIGRFAKSAMNRFKRLEKYSEKSDTKIRKQ